MNVDASGVAGSAAAADALTDVLLARARAAAVADAALLEAVVAVADRDPFGFDADLVAMSLRWTQVAARAQVEFGRYLQRVIKPVWAALCAGDVDVARAHVFHDVLACLDDDVAFTVALDLVDRAAGWTTGQLRQRLRRAVCHVDPDGAEKRTAAKVAQRRVYLTAESDGAAALFATSLPAPRAVAAFERVDAIARARRAAGDLRTLDQLRADTVLDLLEGVEMSQSPILRRGVVEISVPWSTLAGGRAPATSPDVPPRLRGNSDMQACSTAAAPARTAGHIKPSQPVGGAEPATLAGFGPLDAHTARTLVDTMFGRRDIQWRFRLESDSGRLWRLGTLPRPRNLDDLTRELSDIASCATVRPQPPHEVDPRRRKPGPALSRWVRARDGTCRAPGCRTPASVCDLDHTTSYADGGLTRHDNLAVMCRHHHRLKHEGGWRVTQPTAGVLTWASPHGDRFTSQG